MKKIAAALAAFAVAVALAGCASAPASSSASSGALSVDDRSSESGSSEPSSSPVDAARAKLNLIEDYRDSFVHGDKPAEFQKYIVLHDTEGDGDALGVVDYWDGTGTGVASHFVINKDGSIVQCVPIDKIGLWRCGPQRAIRHC